MSFPYDGGLGRKFQTPRQQKKKKETAAQRQLAQQFRQRQARASDVSLKAPIPRTPGQMIQWLSDPREETRRREKEQRYYQQAIEAMKRGVSVDDATKQAQFDVYGTRPSKPLGRAFKEINQQVLEPTELVGGRLFQASPLSGVRDIGSPAALLPQPFRGATEQGIRATTGVDVRAPLRQLGVFKGPTGLAAAVKIPEDLQAGGRAALGGRKEQEEVRDRLRELGIGDRIIGSILYDPANAIPFVGFTKADDFARAFQGIRRGITGIRSSPEAQRLVRALQIVHESEVGGRKIIRPGMRISGVDDVTGEPVEGIVKAEGAGAFSVVTNKGELKAIRRDTARTVTPPSAIPEEIAITPTDVPGEISVDIFRPGQTTKVTEALAAYIAKNPEVTAVRTNIDNPKLAEFIKRHYPEAQVTPKPTKGKPQRVEVFIPRESLDKVINAPKPRRVNPNTSTRTATTSSELLDDAIGPAERATARETDDTLPTPLDAPVPPGWSHVFSDLADISAGTREKTVQENILTLIREGKAKPDETIGTAATAYRLILGQGDARGAAWGDVLRRHQRHRPFEKPVIDVDDNGILSGVEAIDPQKTKSYHLLDVLSRPDDYVWASAEARHAADEYGVAVYVYAKKLVDAGILPKSVFENSFDKGGRYINRIVVEVGDETFAVRPRGRIGSKQRYELPRTRELAGQAGNRNVKYATNLGDNLEEFIKEVERRIADKQFADKISPLGVTPLSKVDPELLADRAALANELKAGRAELRKLYREREVLRRQSVRVGPKHELTARIKAAQARVESARKAAQSTAREKARQLERARRPGPGEKLIAEPFAGGRVFRKDIAEKIERQITLPTTGARGKVTSALELGNDVNRVFRGIWAAGDWSATALQTFSSIAQNPVGWAKMQMYAISSVLDPRIYENYVRRHLSDIDEMVEYGLTFNGSEFTFEEALRGRTGPLLRPFLNTVGKPLAIGADSWNRMLNVLSVEQWKLGREMIEDVGEGTFRSAVRKHSKVFGPIQGKHDDAYGDLASVISHMTGRMSIPEAAKLTPTKSLLLQTLPFAGRYWTANMMLIADLARGGMRGNLARRAAAGYAAMAVGAYSALGFATGETPVLDPRESGKFLSYKVPGVGYVGIGGPVQQIFKLGGAIAKNPKDAPNITLKWSRGKASPSVSLLVDMFSRSTFTGEPLRNESDYIAYAASKVVPFSFQEATHQLARGNPDRALEELKQAPATGLGLRAFPVSKWQLHQEAVLREVQKLHPNLNIERYEDLKGTPLLTQMRDDAETYPETYATWKRYQESLKDKGKDQEVVFEAAQKDRDDREKDLLEWGTLIGWGTPGGGEAYVRQRSNIYSQYSDNYERMFTARGIDPPDADEKNKVALALDSYYALEPIDFWDPAANEVDWKAFKAAQKRILDTLPPAQRKAFEARREVKDPVLRQIEERREKAATQLETYFQGFSKYKGLTLEESSQVDTEMERFSQFAQLASFALGEKIDRRDLITFALQSGLVDKNVGLTMWALTFSALKPLVLSREKEDFVLANPDLAVFYPNTFQFLSDEDKLEWQRLHGHRTLGSLNRIPPAKPLSSDINFENFLKMTLAGVDK